MEKLNDVALTLKANIYFDGKVVSHTIHAKDGSKKTVGLIYPGSYTFDTAAAERMDVLAGACRVKRRGDADWKTYEAGESFQVSGKSSFDIAVDKGLAEYLCSFE